MIDLTPLLRFGLLLVRPGALILAAPAYGGAYAPPPAKIGLTVFVALALLPVARVPAIGEPLALAVTILREMAVGLALAMAIRVLIAGAEFAGHLAGFQMGLSYAAIVDPQSGVRNNVLASLYGNIALITFLMINGHHAFLRALSRSYAALPVGAGGVGTSLPQTVAQMLGLVFTVGVRLAAPIVVVVILVEVAMALLARSAPALNVMIAGAPVRIVCGLVMLGLAVPAAPGMVAGMSDTIVRLAAQMAAAFR